VIGSYTSFVEAMDRVQQRLRKVTAALNEASIRYAVIGGNGVAVWVARADPAATRTTKDVDLLVDRADRDRLVRVMEELGFEARDLRRLLLFVDPEEPSKRSGVHIVWSGEKVLPSYGWPAPCVTEAVFDPEGFWVLDLPALVRMKLTSLRDIDRVHIADLLRVGLLDGLDRNVLPPELIERLRTIEASLDPED